MVTIENVGGGRHGRDTRYTDTNNGVEGRGTMADNTMRTTIETQEDNNGGGLGTTITMDVDA